MKWYIFILISLFIVSPLLSVNAAAESCAEKMVPQLTNASIHCRNCSASQDDIGSTSVTPDQDLRSKPYSELFFPKSSTKRVQKRPDLYMPHVSSVIIHPGSVLHFNCVLLI